MSKKAEKEASDAKAEAKAEVKAEKENAEKELEVDLPEVKLPEAEKKAVEKKEKVKLIKDLPRLYIAGNYYEGIRGQDLIVPSFVAYVLRGSDNVTEVFAV